MAYKVEQRPDERSDIKVLTIMVLVLLLKASQYFSKISISSTCSHLDEDNCTRHNELSDLQKLSGD